MFQGLSVLAEIVNSTHSKDDKISQTQYRKFLVSLLTLFSEEKPFLENRGAFIIRLVQFSLKQQQFFTVSFSFRQLCTLLNAEFIFRIFAEIINEEVSNLKFASTVVRTLNTILLTSSELFELRSLLRDIKNEVWTCRWASSKCAQLSHKHIIAQLLSFQKSASLFQCLYKSWSHCPISTLSLCLLAQCYEHASQIVVLLYPF